MQPSLYIRPSFNADLIERPGVFRFILSREQMRATTWEVASRISRSDVSDDHKNFDKRWLCVFEGGTEINGDDGTPVGSNCMEAYGDLFPAQFTF